MNVQVLNAPAMSLDPAVLPKGDRIDLDRFLVSAKCGSVPVRTLEAQDALFCEGDRKGYLYEVLDGVVCSYKLLPDGRRQVISFSYPGDLVGLGSSEAYSFSADAVTETRVRVISAAQLDRRIRVEPELAGKLLEATTAELSRVRDRLMTLGRRNALERLASFLVEVGERAGAVEQDSSFDLPMTRADIADFLGLTIETVSRNLTKLRVASIIDLPQPTRVVIRDMAELMELAECDEDD